MPNETIVERDAAPTGDLHPPTLPDLPEKEAPDVLPVRLMAVKKSPAFHYIFSCLINCLPYSLFGTAAVFRIRRDSY